MVAYADTSFLFSLYAQDANTSRAAKTATAIHSPLVITPLQAFELRNALRLAVFRGDITESEQRRLHGLIEADAKAGSLVETPVSWAEVYACAEVLSAAHTTTLGTRGFDILHVATAAAIGAKAFCTFDARQKALALKAGMKVKP
ncbi:MAG: PIN domain-containing protein [Kiritimatiellia bacterium]